MHDQITAALGAVNGGPVSASSADTIDAAPDRWEPSQVSPVFGRPLWLGDTDLHQPLTLRLWPPVSSAELAAALYDDHQLSPDDLADDTNVQGLAAAAIASRGQAAVLTRAWQIEAEEAQATLANPAWLDLCRRRVADVTGHAWANSAADPDSGSFMTTCPVVSRQTRLVHAGALTEIAAPCHAGS